MNLPRLGDTIAIPFFLWLVAYFWKKPDRTPEETVLMAFCAGGAVADIYFVGAKLR
jgi:hypothetical protein